MKPEHPPLRDLLDRLARVVASEAWWSDLNPTQRAALDYLARANRFSRSPSNVADYLHATRGTVSQTLKALARKDLVEEVKSETDRRSISYEVTPRGRSLADDTGTLEKAANALPKDVAKRLTRDLSLLLREMLAQRHGQSFGVCKTCKHHQTRKIGGWCALLDVELGPPEIHQLCHEHAPAE